MNRDLFKRVKRATVALGVMDPTSKAAPFQILGTGFCIDATGIVITCRHVLDAFMSKPIMQQIQEMAQEEHNQDEDVLVTGPLSEFRVIRPYAIFYDTESSRENMYAFPVPVEHAMAKTDFDLGMVRVPLHVRYKPAGYPTLEIEDYENVEEGDEIALCGFPLGTFLQQQLGTITSSFSKGIVSSIIPAPGIAVEYVKGFQLNIAATHGNSGGPVFSLTSGKVFGVLTEGLPDRDGLIVPGIVKAEPVYPVLEHDSVKRMKTASAENSPRMPL
jgi:S1-C subfamily serine protease